jgi:hypothetical protein
MIKLQLNAEKMNQGGAKLPPGRFGIRIEKVIVKTSKRFATPGDKVVIEFDVLKVYSKSVPYKDWKGNMLDANEGERRSYTIDMAKGDIAIGNVTAFTIAACGVNPRDAAAVKAAKDPEGKNMNLADAEGLTGWAKAFCSMQEEANPARGVELDVETHPETTGANRTIMVHDFSPAQDEATAAA